MFRAIGRALGLFLLFWGGFLFCTEDIVLRYHPDWIPTSGFPARFFQEDGDRLHLVVEQWIAILIGAGGLSIFILFLGGRKRSAKSDESS